MKMDPNGWVAATLWTLALAIALVLLILTAAAGRP